MARRRNEDIEVEREFEERFEAKRRRGAIDYPDPPRHDRKKQKPPLLLRFLAWCGVILFCFVAGYVGTGYMVKKFGLDKPWATLRGTVGDNGATAVETEFSDSGVRLDVQKASFSVFYPKEGELLQETLDVMARTLEDNIHEAVHRILKLSGMDAVGVLHVFRDVDTVYLDLSSPFLDSLREIGEKEGSLLITAVVRTMSDNFSLTKVRFLVDSKVAGSEAPVDLTAVWQLQR